MVKKLTRQEIARTVAHDIPEGFYVNLGIGMPTLVSAHLPTGKGIVLHTENGILGMGPGKPDEPLDLDLINASKEAVTLIPGSSICDHVTSFSMMRGGHIDLTILGAFQVSGKGDLANWDTGAPNTIPAVGGAMDLVVGAKNVYITMEHVARDGTPKIVEQCTYPLTGIGVVDRIYTDLAIIHITDDGLVVTGMVPDMTLDALQNLTECSLRLSPDCKVIM